MDRCALEKLTVIEYAHTVAGAYCGKLLADMGGDVIKIEGHKRMDFLRRTYPWPLSEAVPIQCPINQGTSYNQVNLNKKSLTLDLTQSKGLNLARKLAAISDIVLDNMRPGAMDKLGLGYDDLRKLRSDIIVIASSSHGLGGPYTNHLGLATIHHGIGGGSYITGHPEVGVRELIGPPWRFSGFDIPQNHAPLLGEHNAYVLGELLGLSESEINDLREEEIIFHNNYK